MGSTAAPTSTRVGALSGFSLQPFHSSLRKGAPMTNSTIKSAALAVALVIATMAQASAQSGPTMPEKMACRADAESFCSQFIGKAPQMRACLAQNKAKLSTSCRAVVGAHGG